MARNSRRGENTGREGSERGTTTWTRRLKRRLKGLLYAWWRFCGKLNRTYWALRHRTINRYDRVSLQSKYFGYKYGYLDIPERMLLANFNLLVDFVENESPDLMNPSWAEIRKKHKTPKYTCDSERKYFRRYWERMKTVHELYLWWTVKRVAKCNAVDKLLALKDKPENCYSMIWKLDQEIERDDEKMLLKLMKVRPSLWT